MRGYLYFSSLGKISLVKCQDKLVEMTPDVVICAVDIKLSDNSAEYNRVNKKETSTVNIQSADLPTPPCAPKASPASSCFRKKEMFVKGNNSQLQITRLKNNVKRNRADLVNAIKQ